MLVFYFFKMLKWLYNLLGFIYMLEVNVYVYYLIRVGVLDECFICVVRVNFFVYVYFWKKIFNRIYLDEIKEVCGFYMKDFGYM